jgi:hypothetical protein
MTYRPGDAVTVTGIYWCTVCKLPAQFTAGDQFPGCKNMCGRGAWKLVQEADEPEPGPSAARRG